MTARRRTIVLLSLLLTAAACARIRPTVERDVDGGHSAKPRVDMTPQRRREGSDVSGPPKTDPTRLVGILLPCDSAAGKPPIVSECPRINLTSDSLGTAIDTSTQRRP